MSVRSASRKQAETRPAVMTMCKIEACESMRPFVLSLMLLAAGCASTAHQAPPAVERTLLLPGVRLEAPAGGNWVTAVREAERVVLERTAPGVTAMLVAEVLPADVPSDDGAFLQEAEARQEAAVSALEMVSVHYNQTTLGGAACLAYDGIYRDARASGPARAFRKLEGYVCRERVTGARPVRLELTLYAASRTPPEVEELLGIADTFFRSARFGR